MQFYMGVMTENTPKLPFLRPKLPKTQSLLMLGCQINPIPIGSTGYATVKDGVKGRNCPEI